MSYNIESMLVLVWFCHARPYELFPKMDGKEGCDACFGAESVSSRDASVGDDACHDERERRGQSRRSRPVPPALSCTSFFIIVFCLSFLILGSYLMFISQSGFLCSSTNSGDFERVHNRPRCSYSRSVRACSLENVRAI